MSRARTFFASTVYVGCFPPSAARCVPPSGVLGYGSGCWWWNLLCSYWIQLSSKKLTANRTTHRKSTRQTTSGKENHLSLIFLDVSARDNDGRGTTASYTDGNDRALALFWTAGTCVIIVVLQREDVTTRPTDDGVAIIVIVVPLNRVRARCTHSSDTCSTW